MVASNPLQQLGDRGQSVWLDFISRELVTTDQLRLMIDENRVTGMTSNPTIFEKAIAEGDHYDQQLRELIAEGVHDPEEQFLALAISDIQRATDALEPVWEQADGADGFVSLEVPPSLADDTDGTVAFAQRIWDTVQRPNLMVKIPATPAGIPAIRRSIAAGININVTLIFALAAHEQVIDAYLSGLEDRVKAGQPPDVHSVASFFVSRVDTAVDPMLEQRLQEPHADRELIEGLFGKAAIANAQLAYEVFERHFCDGQRYQALRRLGAPVQRPLWASTSAKNPKYRDVLYAEALIGPDTVDTMPPATIDAFRDHGRADGDTVNADYAGAHRVMEQLQQAGIDIDAVTQHLLEEGVRSFAKSFEQLTRRIAEKTDTFQGHFARRQQLDLGGVTEAVRGAIADPAGQQVVRRIWNHDPDVWKPGDAEHAAEIAQRLGWLTVMDTMRSEGLPRLLALQTAVRTAEFRDAVVLGMGGSSLGPEVLRAAFGSAAGHPTLHVLDTTDPAAIARVTAHTDASRTLYIVSSKSGGTLETLSHMAYFWERTRAAVAEPGGHFVCVTDPGTSLGEHARIHSFRAVFDNPPDIGGRYSVLSYFGLVPAAVAGLDIETLLDRACAMASRCAPGVPGDLNCGLVLGTTMGLLHQAGRDKVTILAPKRIAAFSLWAEQLIAESTGKEGRAIVPIGTEPIGAPAVYGNDRLFVALDLGDDAEFSSDLAALRAAGLPMITFALADLYDLAAEFFRWEFATAVAGHHLQVDVFDQPNVQESKDNTQRILDLFARSGTVSSSEKPSATRSALSVFAQDVPGDTPAEVLRSFVNAANPGDYVAIMAYIDPNQENENALQLVRTLIRNGHRVATTLGFGPRFLHSTGQMHKGGPNTGVFIQITQDDPADLEIPGKPFTFSTLKQAQARGDLDSLRSHGRRAIRLHISGDVAQTLHDLSSSLHTAGATH